MTSRNILVKTLVGSRLYGLENAESDIDYSSIYLPTLDQLLLGKFPELIDESTSTAITKNTKDDKDVYIYALPYFIFLAINGKQQVIDMLHARPETTVETSALWEELKSVRSHFYSKSMSSSIDFIAKQIMIYGTRIKALEELEKLKGLLYELRDKNGNVKLREVAHLLPVSDTCYFVTTHEGNNTQVEWKDNSDKIRSVFYRVDGGCIEVSLSLTQLCRHTEERVNRRNYETNRYIRENGGKRTNGNWIKWSEITHAMRVGYQVKSILMNGDFEYPLPETDFLLKMKAGEMDFITDVQPHAEELITTIKRLMFTSNLPDRVDEEYWEKWLLDVYRRHYQIS